MPRDKVFVQGAVKAAQYNNSPDFPRASLVGRIDPEVLLDADFLSYLRNGTIRTCGFTLRVYRDSKGYMTGCLEVLHSRGGKAKGDITLPLSLWKDMARAILELDLPDRMPE